LRESRMREICTSGSTRGEVVVPLCGIASSPTLPHRRPQGVQGFLREVALTRSTPPPSPRTPWFIRKLISRDWAAIPPACLAKTCQALSSC